MNALPAFKASPAHIAQAATDPDLYEILLGEITLRGEYGDTERFKTAVRQQQAQGRDGGAR